MKTVVNSILLTGAMVIGTNGLMAAPMSNDYFEQWFKAKYGRSTPTEEARQNAEARLNAERKSTAFREQVPGHLAPTSVNWIEEHFKAKLGRNTPAVEAQLRLERENSAFRAEPAPEIEPKPWFEEWHRTKYGRYPGK